MLKRLREIAALEETTPGTERSGTYAAANAKFLVIDPQYTADVPMFERDIVRNTLTPLQKLPGIKFARLTFGIELAGHALGTPDLPPWDRFMKACGFRSKSISKITIGAITNGPFRHGETLTQATSGATAKVVHDTYSGTTTLFVSDITGTPNNVNIWTGGSTAATATPSTVATDDGQGWWPITFPTQIAGYSGASIVVGDVVKGATSLVYGIVREVGASITLRPYFGAFTNETINEVPSGGSGTTTSITWLDIPSLTICFNEDGHLRKLIGARGTMSLEARIGEPPILRFEFMGKVGTPLDNGMLTGVAYESKVPATWLNASARFGHEGDTLTSQEYNPRMSAFTMNMNNELSMRKSVNESTGLIECMITGRGITGSIDPEMDLENAFPFFQDFLDGDVWRFRTFFGTVAANKFLLTLSGIQTQGMPSGDREGISTHEISYEASGGYQTNVTDTPGSENDCVLTYHLS